MDKRTTYVLYALAIWRVSSMLVQEEGPGDIFVKLRHKVGVQHDMHNRAYGESFISKLFTCVVCMSVWISTFFVIGDKIQGGLMRSASIPLALSTGAIIINRWIVRDEKQ